MASAVVWSICTAAAAIGTALVIGMISGGGNPQGRAALWLVGLAVVMLAATAGWAQYRAVLGRSANFSLVISLLLFLAAVPGLAGAARGFLGVSGIMPLDPEYPSFLQVVAAGFVFCVGAWVAYTMGNWGRILTRLARSASNAGS